eukprot:Sdes_comp15755_c1_seq1m4807
MKMEQNISVTVIIDSHSPNFYMQEITAIGSHGRLVANGTQLMGSKNPSSSLPTPKLDDKEPAMMEVLVAEEIMPADVKRMLEMNRSNSGNDSFSGVAQEKEDFDQSHALQISNLKSKTCRKSIYNSKCFLLGTFHHFQHIKNVFEKIASSQQERNSINWDEFKGHLADFKDAFYAQTVLDSLRLANNSGKWIKIDSLKQDSSDYKSSSFWSPPSYLMNS